ncbi:hypothetical protein [Thalassobacillus sp. C254]|uniref:hypothetical protein n=1 Tax=Thalassobacillus sp. C254 TaxID=1225341 RepID=UPI0006D0119D|nr:hypothetical protein [Thalassobacillus sp. C254]
MEIWIPVIVAILSGVSSYLLAVKNTKDKIKILEKNNEVKIESMEKEHAHQIELMQKQIEMQSQREKDQSINDLTKGFIEKAMSQSMDGLGETLSKQMEDEIKKNLHNKKEQS